MINTTCPNCGVPLRLELLASDGLRIYCGSCQKGVPSQFLIQSGLPESLLQRLEKWANRSSNLTDFTGPNRRGSHLDDQEFVVRWRDLYAETADLVSQLGSYLVVRALVDSEVYETRRREEWTDSEILRWRQEQLRLGGISDYGILIGARYFDEGNPRPTKMDELDIQSPDGLNSEVERNAFHAGFCWASIFGSWAEPDQVENELARLEAELGIRAIKKPSGGRVPPDGCRDEGDVRGR